MRVFHIRFAECATIEAIDNEVTKLMECKEHVKKLIICGGNNNRNDVTQEKLNHFLMKLVSKRYLLWLHSLEQIQFCDSLRIGVSEAVLIQKFISKVAEFSTTFRNEQNKCRHDVTFARCHISVDALQHILEFSNHPNNGKLCFVLGGSCVAFVECLFHHSSPTPLLLLLLIEKIVFDATCAEIRVVDDDSRLYRNIDQLVGVLANYSFFSKIKKMYSYCGVLRTDHDIFCVAESLNKTQIEELHLSTCIGDFGASQLANALLHNQSLRYLKLSNCRMTAIGAMCIAEALKYNCTLQQLKNDNEIIRANNKVQEKVNYYLGLNRIGRKRILQADLPASLFSVVFEGTKRNPSIIYWIMKQFPAVLILPSSNKQQQNQQRGLKRKR